MKITILDHVAWAQRRDVVPTQGVIDITKGHGQGDGHGYGAGGTIRVACGFGGGNAVGSSHRSGSEDTCVGYGVACGTGDGQGKGVGEARNEMLHDYLERMNVPRYRAGRMTK